MMKLIGQIRSYPFIRIATLAIALLAIGSGVIATAASPTPTDGLLATVTADRVTANQLPLVPEYATPRSSQGGFTPYIRQAADCKKRFYPCSKNDECCSGVCGSGGACVGTKGQ